jgi:class 3 adenylate cyclase/tetratricopeptide (TPR) repeat protein
MRCTACGTELLAGKRFCHACGARAPLACEGCGATVSPDFRFCPDCGLAVGAARVHDAAPPPAEDALARHARSLPEGLAHRIRAAQEAIAGERKQVTVLFCDLAGSTAIAERLDPEEYHDLLDEYLALAFHEIYRFDGIVNQLAGDGMMALFGAPIAHEDAPQRAIRAALAIHAALKRLSRPGIELTARIGIHTGPVVVGTVGNDFKMDYTAIGDTTNLASRLQTLADPGSILVSEATHRLARGFFTVSATGPHAIKGKSEPVVAYEVLGESASATPMTIAAARGLTPLVGRDPELTQLEASFRRLEASPQVVAVVGDAGLGKSRLVYEFRQRLGDEAVFLEGRCSSIVQEVPYFPFVTMLKQYFGIAAGDTPKAARARVTEKLGDHAHKVRAAYPALSRLLGTMADTGEELGAEEIKRETFNAVTWLLLQESQHRPMVMTIEDLHWIDESSRELLESLLARLSGVRAMVILTHRPDDRAVWRTRAAFTQLVLHRLSDEEVLAMVRAVAGGPPPAALERLVVDKAEGSPFCAEEITRSLIEEGYLVPNGGAPKLTRPVEDIRIPGTVQEVIAARLDRLGAQAKRVVQVAAVLGRQFSGQQLAQLLESESLEPTPALAELEARGILHRKSLLSSEEYRFGESLTQEVAYEGLLLKQRRQLHERIGNLIEAQPGDMTAERSALLAHHFTRGENREKALDALLRAADDAERLPSYRTAVDLFRRAWELGEAALKDSADDRHRHAVLTASAGLARLHTLFGWPSRDEAERAAIRARDLAEALGATETLASLLYFHGVITMLGGRDGFATGLALAEQGVALAEQAGLKLTAMRLSRGLAINYTLDGRFDLARRVMGWVMAELEADGHRSGMADIYVSARWVHDSVLYLSDDLDAALKSAPVTHDLAVRAPNRTVRCGVASTLAQIQFLRGEYAEARRWADDSLEVAEAIANVAALPGPAAIALLTRIELGEPADTERYLDLIDQGLSTGGTVQSNYRFVADAFLAVGDRQRMEGYAEAWQKHAPGSGRLREAFVTNALGEMLAALGRHDEAARALGRALALAESINSRSVMVGATLALAEVAAIRGDPAPLGLIQRAVGLARDLGLVRYLPRLERVLRDPQVSAQA